MPPDKIKQSSRIPMLHKKAILLGVLVLIAAMALWCVRPTPTYDIAQVHSRLRALQQPYQSVKTGYYADGGSIGIEIVDRDGRREQFAIPAHLGDTNRYTKVYVGALHDRKPEAIEIVQPEHTRRMLVCILHDNPKRTAWDDYCLMALRGSPVDYARCLIHKLRGDFK